VVVSHWLLPALKQRPFVYGPFYGVVAFFVMNLVVIPLSAIGVAPSFTVFGTTNGLLIHAFGIGLPTALVASRVAPRLA
jgi:O-antigen/teichoic acid export membrane protein